MIGAMLAGALCGLGILLLVLQLVDRPVAAAAQVARLDADRRRQRRDQTLVADRRHETENLQLRQLGQPLAKWLTEHDVRLARVRADLAMVGRSFEAHVAQSVLAGAAGFVLPLLVVGLLSFVVDYSATVPLVVALVGAVVGLLLPTLQLQSRATARRRDFAHALGSFLDLVAMNLSGGRGVPEALQSASSISSMWAMLRIRDTLERARLLGMTPWAALGELGDELDVDELRDLAAALGLVAEDGAKVRDSLAARATSMRTKELAALESQAESNSQSMLVAQLLLCVGFLVFLTYPAVANVMAS
ncbi:type II secretion system F family protein [Angustibacter aerolatus]